ncbi:MAG: hypothetical protein SH868_16410 [Bythopirellula sp.]|nr:hypothetical protein [Bythopirellula sp.]
MLRPFWALALAIAFIVSQGVGHAQSWTFDADALFLKLGTSVGTADEDVFDYETGSRLAISRLGASDVGFRTTWFQWDHAATDSAVGFIELETYNLDFEIFKRLDLSNRTTLELSGGVRYNETDYIYDGAPNDFNGVGGLVGLRGGLQVLENGVLYARSKFAVLMGDGAHDGDDEDLDPAFDVIRSQTEISLGYEHRFTMGNLVIVPRSGVEWQNWEGFGIDPVDEHPDNALGLFGFVGGVSVTY